MNFNNYRWNTGYHWYSKDEDTTPACSVCGNKQSEQCCMIAHAAHQNPEVKVWMISCPCKRCSPFSCTV